MAEVTLYVPDSYQPQQQSREAGQLAEQLSHAMAEQGIGWTQLFLGLDMAGFQRLGADFSDFRDLSPQERTAVVKRSRLYWQFEPLADRMVGIWTEYAFGRGWTIEAEDAGFQAVLDEVLGARFNRRQFSGQGWMRSSNSLLVDGERWFVYWPNRDGEIRVRNFDPLEIAEVLTNPEDKDEIWYYRRTWADADGKLHTRFYRDWDHFSPNGQPRNDPHPRMSDRIADAGALGEVDWRPVEGAWVNYLAINTLGLRGYPLLTASLDWVRSHREFMRDRSSINTARAQFAWQGSVKGGQADLNRVRSAFDAPDPATTSDGLRTARAGTFWGNEGVDLKQVSMQTDGSSAQHDQRGFRAMAALPSGLPDFVLGDTGSANLATAQALERPLETMFSAYQEQWVEYIEDLAYHVARWKGFGGNSEVHVDPPSIFARNPADMARGLADLIRAVPAIGTAPQVVQMVLTDYGVEDVEGAMAIIEPLLGLEPAQEEPGMAEALESIRESARR